MENTRNNNKHLTLGIVLIAVGIAFLLKNLNILPDFFVHNFFNWKSLLIAIGVAQILTSDKPIMGVALIAVGGFFILPDIFHFPFNFRHLFWPVIFIFIGAYILFKRRKQSFFDSSINDDDIIEGAAIFGGGKKKVNNPFFRGGTITAIFGGYDIDLSDADLSEGENVLDVFIVFGGVKLIVPNDWRVDVKTTVALGGINDKRFQQSIEVMPGKILTIEGIILFGGCDIIGSHVKYR